MALTYVYRVQPAGLDLGEHRSRTSANQPDRGVHVYGSLAALSEHVNELTDFGLAGPEVVEIECDDAAIGDDADYQGYVLIANAGRIVRRKTLADGSALQAWATRRALDD